LLIPNISFDRAHRVLSGTQVFTPGTGDATNIFRLTTYSIFFREIRYNTCAGCEYLCAR